MIKAAGRVYSGLPVRHTSSIALPLLLVFLVNVCQGAQKPWVEVRSPHFRVLSDSSGGDAKQVAREFEQIRLVFASGFPGLRLDSGTPLLVLAVHDESGMKALAPRIWKMKGAKPAGFFERHWEKEFAVVRLDEIGPDAYQVVYHEYVHSLLHLNFRYLPVWLDEGSAEFFGNTHPEKDRILIGVPSPRIAVLRQKPLIPVATLLTINQASPYYHDESMVQVFYAEAWALTHYLHFGPGMDKGNKFRTYMALLEQGVDDKKAFTQVFGDTHTVDQGLGQYIRNYSMLQWVLPNPPQINEKEFTVRRMSPAETAAELGGYHIWAHNADEAKELVEEALHEDPKLALAHEDNGFLEFAAGNDNAAHDEFVQASQLAPKLYLSLYYAAMLSPEMRSDTAADQNKIIDMMLKVLDANPRFAPAYIECAKIFARQGNLTQALAVARKAEELEPSRAGYHIFSAELMLRMGQAANAANVAQHVAERWPGTDHDEAVDLWNQIPAAQRPAGDLSPEPAPPGTQTMSGTISKITCASGKSPVISLQNGKINSEFHTGALRIGFADTLWYGEDHFNLCHHTEGMRVTVRYRPSSSGSYTGDASEIHFLDEPGGQTEAPAPKAVANPEHLSNKPRL